MSGRRSYNEAMASWWKKHPTLAQLRQLSGKDDVRHLDAPRTEAEQYASEQCPLEPEDEVKDYRDRRGE